MTHCYQPATAKVHDANKSNNKTINRGRVADIRFRSTALRSRSTIARHGGAVKRADQHGRNVTTQNAVGITVTIVGIVGAIVILLLLDPVAQDPRYHQFSDSRTLWHTPNFLNVLSNIPFALVGIWGLIQLRESSQLKIVRENRLAYKLFSISLLLVFVGSTWYHLDPGNATLVWDRLPMAVGFMALFSIVISEFVSARLGKSLLMPLLVFGLFSVCYWWLTETRGQGDLRWYLIVQFLPMLLIPTFMVVYRSQFTHTSGYWLLLLAYIAAKFFEHYDGQTYSLSGGVISGHSIKHIVAATGVYMLLRSFELRGDDHR